MNLIKTTLLSILLTSLCLVSCKENIGPVISESDNFDRNQMLTDWADLIIIPGFESYEAKLKDLRSIKDDYIADATTDNLLNLRTAYLEAYLAWQKVSMFDIGRAESIGLRNYTNIYPTDTQGIITNIVGENYNLELPSNFDTQGFPALDYLLYGIGDSDFDINSKLSTSDYTQYLNALVNRLDELCSNVVADWKTDFRSSFISNDGASSTASVDKMVNDFLFYYEKYLRAGKVGIPAGVFSGNPLPNAVEAPYSNVHSKAIFQAGFEAVQDFFSGTSFQGNQTGASLDSYLRFLAEQNNSFDIGEQVKSQWTIVNDKIAALDNSFQDQVIDDNSKMLETYDELQKAVIILKVDMMQALNIQVDYVDADGD